MQNSFMALGFDLTGEVRDYSFSSGLGLGGRGKTMLVRENFTGQHVCHNSLFAISYSRR